MWFRIKGQKGVWTCFLDMMMHVADVPRPPLSSLKVWSKSVQRFAHNRQKRVSATEDDGRQIIALQMSNFHGLALLRLLLTRRSRVFERHRSLSDFITFENIRFRKYVGRHVCMFVCLFVCLSVSALQATVFDISLRYFTQTLVQVITRCLLILNKIASRTRSRSPKRSKTHFWL